MVKAVAPLFEIGKIPGLPHCEIQKIEERQGKYYYAVRNNYNPWASGWADEDFIIEQVVKNKQDVN